MKPLVAEGGGPLIPPDMAVEIERYMDSLKAKGQPADLTTVLRKLLRLGLDRVKPALPPAPLRPLRVAPYVPPPAPNTPTRVSPPEIITHAWAPGAVLPCGVWKSGNRHAATYDQVSCKACRAKRR